MAHKSGVFLRDATGLVREFGALDTLWFNICSIGLLYSMFYVTSFGPIVGGDPLVGVLLPLVGFIFVGATFSYVATKIPRSASDYVYVSRNLNPALGFVSNAGLFVSIVPLFMGLGGITINTIGLVPFLTVLGYYGQNPALISAASAISGNVYYLFAITAIEIIVVGSIPIYGAKVYKIFQGIIIPLAIVAAVMMILTEIVVPTSVAISNLNSFASYLGTSNLSSTVSAASVAVPAYEDLGGTLTLNCMYAIGFIYIISSVYIAGEARNAKRSMPFSIVGALIMLALLYSLSTYFEYYQWGYAFISKLSSLSFAGGLSIPTPYLDLLEGIGSGSFALAAFFTFVTFLQILSFQAVASYIGSRALFSYSMDRILPAAVGNISGRFNTLANAVIISILAGLIGLVVFSLPATAVVAFLLSSVIVAINLLFPVLIVCIAVIKNEWKSNKRMAIIGALGAVYSAYTLYQYLTIGALGMASSLGYSIFIGTIVILFATFYISKYVRKGQGINFDQIFGQIPPE